jgi:predicted glycosyltransferase
MSLRLRCLLYCQHIYGSGHFVRTFEIARELARFHDVHVVDGGRPVPRAPGADLPRLISIPRIGRDATGLVSLDEGRGIDEVFDVRRARLLAAIDAIRPDIVTIEHFPFSKWILGPEILSLIARARAVNPRVRVVCSLRDITPLTREDQLVADHRHRVIETLRGYFDLLLVHADPRMVRLDEQLDWTSEIPIPMHYTGFVSEKPRPGAVHLAGGSESSTRPVLVSSGGAGMDSLRPLAIAAWRLLARRGHASGRELVAFLPLDAGRSAAVSEDVAEGGAGIRLLPFSADFLAALMQAHLSISHAGYNTCMNLLETRTRAILVPNREVSDQAFRARRLADLGLAISLDPRDLDVSRLADAIELGLSAERPRHEFDLDGARTTRRILESC